MRSVVARCRDNGDAATREVLEDSALGLKCLFRISVFGLDNVRWMGLAALMQLAGWNQGMSDHALRNLSDRVYTQMYDMPILIRADQALIHRRVRPVSIPSAIIPLSRTDLSAMLRACQQMRAHWFGSVRHPSCDGLTSSLGLLGDLSGKIEAHLAAADFGAQGGQAFRDHGFFVKLSSRSPKDSYLRQAREDKAGEHWMKVHSGAEACDLLVTSQRVEEDIEAEQSAMLEGSSDGPAGPSAVGADPVLSIIARQWVPCRAEEEFRAFVYDWKLCACSQYFCNNYYATLPAQTRVIQDALLAAFDSRIQPMLRETGLRHVVLDIVIPWTNGPILSEDIFVVEVNSYGFRSGACLFDWDTAADMEVLTGASPFEMRVVHSPSETR
jgi:hypothetical protein